MTLQSSKNSIIDLSGNIILNGGLNTNNSNGFMCNNGAVGSLCILDSQVNDTQVIIDGKNLPTTNALILNATELAMFNKTKIMDGALVSFKTDPKLNFVVTINSLDITNANFTDSFMASAQLYNVTYSILYSFVLRDDS